MMNSSRREQRFSKTSQPSVATRTQPLRSPGTARAGGQPRAALGTKAPLPAGAAASATGAAQEKAPQQRPAPAPGRNVIPLWSVALLLGIMLLLALAQPLMEAALTLPPQKMAPERQSSTAGSQTPASRPQTAATTLPGGMSMLAEDSFQRADQAGWGVASDGHLWQEDAAHSGVFSISNHQGRISNGEGAYNAILGPTFSNGEILFTGTISRFQQSNLGAVLRWMDGNNWYKAYIDGTQLVLLKSSGGMQTRLAAVPFTAQANRFYALRFRIQGPTLEARAWPAGSAEPGEWMVVAHDDTFQSGFGGLRLVTAPGITITITSFQELVSS